MTATRFLLTVLFSFLVCGASAVEPRTVFLTYSGDDADISRRFQYELREQFAKSATLRLVDNEQESQISLRLVAMDAEKARAPSARIVYSVVLTTPYGLRGQHFLTSSVGICGLNKLSDCVAGIVADVATDEIRHPPGCGPKDWLPSDPAKIEECLKTPQMMQRILRSGAKSGAGNKSVSPRVTQPAKDRP